MWTRQSLIQKKLATVEYLKEFAFLLFLYFSFGSGYFYENHFILWKFF